jgi:hypothetical protein
VGDVNDLTPPAETGTGEAIAKEGIFAGQARLNGWPRKSGECIVEWLEGLAAMREFMCGVRWDGMEQRSN